MFKALGEIAGDDVVTDCMREIAIKKAGDAVEDGLRKCLGGGNDKRDGGDSKGGFDIGNIISGNAVESGVKNFLDGEEQKDDGGKEDKEGFSFGKFLSSGDDGQKDVNEGSPSGGQTDEDNSGFGLANALNPCGGGQNDPDNGGLGSGDAKGGGQKNDDNTGAGEPGIDAAAAALGDLFDQ